MQKGDLLMSSMKIRFSASDVFKFKADALVLPLEKEAWDSDELFVRINTALDGLALKMLRKIDFKAEKNSYFLLQTVGRLPFDNVLFIGLGDESLDAAAV